MALLTAKNKIPGATSGTEVLSRMVELSGLQTDPDFETLFPINAATKIQIVERMKKYGFDKSQPIIVWKEENVILDGHTRRSAALEAEIKNVYISEKSFETKTDAMEYVLGLQTARRNLTDAEMAVAIIKLDQLKSRGRKSGDEEGPKGKSAALLAQTLNTSTSKVEKFRAVETKATEDVKQAVLSGEMSINKAYETTRKEPIKSEPTKETLSEEQSPFDITIQFEEETSYENMNLSSGIENERLPLVELQNVIEILKNGHQFMAINLLLQNLDIIQTIKEKIISQIPEIQILKEGD